MANPKTLPASRKLRIFRSVLVVVVNGWLAYSGITNIVETRTAQRADPVLHFHAAPVTVADVLWTSPLLIGIAVEFTSFQLARFVNITYYALSAAYIIIG